MVGESAASTVTWFCFHGIFLPGLSAHWAVPIHRKPGACGIDVGVLSLKAGVLCGHGSSPWISQLDAPRSPMPHAQPPLHGLFPQCPQPEAPAPPLRSIFSEMENLTLLTASRKHWEGQVRNQEPEQRPSEPVLLPWARRDPLLWGIWQLPLWSLRVQVADGLTTGSCRIQPPCS